MTNSEQISKSEMFYNASRNLMRYAKRGIGRVFNALSLHYKMQNAGVKMDVNGFNKTRTAATAGALSLAAVSMATGTGSLFGLAILSYAGGVVGPAIYAIGGRKSEMRFEKEQAEFQRQLRQRRRAAGLPLDGRIHVRI